MLPPPVPVRVRVEGADVPSEEKVFLHTFCIGRSAECDIQVVGESVSRRHAEVQYNDGCWRISDLNSSNGVYIGERRVEGEEPIPPNTKQLTLRLGPEGPRLRLSFSRPVPTPAPAAHSQVPEEDSSSVTQFVARLLKGSQAHDAGERTLFVREALRRVTKKQSRKYHVIIGVAIVCLLGAASYIWVQHQKLEQMKRIAADIFYSMKQIELQTATLEDLVVASEHQEELMANRKKLKELERQYERYLRLNKIGAFEESLSEQEKVVYRIARLFGECDADMPKEFISAVMSYIKKWQSTDRLATAMQKAEVNGLTPKIAKAMLAQNLPPQFFYLALQESNFNERAVGPRTTSGIAKGIWQFIPGTAIQYGLKTGPLIQLSRYDPADERFNIDKSTVAASRYLKRLYTTDAQASGLLVIAAYNWGEGRVIRLINQMPKNPKERNFWQLLKRYRKSIPRETYDYVLFIVSAAAIGENPRLFGFSFGNPYANLQ